MVDLLVIKENISVHFDLNVEDLELIGCDLQLIGLAVELKTLNWVHETTLVLRKLLGLDEGKLNVRVKIGAQIFEWQLEFLNALSLFNSERNNVLASDFVVKLSHTLNLWIVKVSKQQNFKLLGDWLLLEDHAFFFVAHVLLLGGLNRRFLELDVNERNNSTLQFVLWGFNNDDEFLVSLWTNLKCDAFLKLF